MEHEIDTPYIPNTLNGIIGFLQGLIAQEENHLTGEEFIVDAWMTEDNGERVPPYTITFTIRKGTNVPGKWEYGTIVMMPGRVSELM